MPTVAFLTMPPDLFPRPGGEALRGYSVSLRVPLLRQLRMRGCQVVFPRHHRPVGAVWTACPRHPGFHRRLPAMPLPAAPPQGLVAAVGKGGKRYTGVLFRVKLLEQGFFALGHTIVIKALFHWHHLP